MPESLITNPIGILAVLAGICAFMFWLEKATGWKLFNFFPPLLFIYAIPAICSNSGLIPTKSPVYGTMSDMVLPIFLVLMLINVDVRGAIKVMGKGIFVLLLGTAGVMIGAPVAYFIVKSGLQPDTWRGFGALAGSWIGGTGNMAAVSEMVQTSGEDFGLAVLADNLVYVIWLPIMLGSKNLAGWFNRFTGVSAERLRNMQDAAEEMKRDKGKPMMRHLLYLFFLGLGVAWLSAEIAEILPVVHIGETPFLSAGSWRILLVSTLGLLLSATPARNVPGSHALAMALVYLFVANMGAKAEIAGLTGGTTLWFLVGAYIWIFIHGTFCLIGARIFRVDVHTAAIASAANIGGAASAPVVAAYHDERLVPVSILMALIGYAVGTYAGWGTAWLCYFVS